MKEYRLKMEMKNRKCTMQTNWETFDIVTDDEIYNCEAKVYSEGSEYGINNGRVSKLYVKEWCGFCVANYDRGYWDVEPQGISKTIVDFIVEFYEKNKPLFCDMDTSSW